LFMGTIYRFSGLDRVIREFPDLLAKHPNARLLIVGTGEDETRLKGLAVEHGVSPSVVFTGLQPYAALPDIIRASDICINPFELNGVTQNILPTKLFQYLACGRPVLATELPGTLPFLEGEQHGIVYADLDHFVSSLSQLMSDPAKMSRLGASAAAVVRIYGWTEIAKTMVAWMEELTEELT
jgi:glycosyltransferase involved in cell wall biosynthesis